MRRGHFRPQEAIPGMLWVKLVLGFLSVSFVAASLLAFRFTEAAVRAFYKIAAVWLGFLTFLFFAAIFSWCGTSTAMTLLAAYHIAFVERCTQSFAGDVHFSVTLWT